MEVKGDRKKKVEEVNQGERERKKGEGEEATFMFLLVMHQPQQQ